MKSYPNLRIQHLTRNLNKLAMSMERENVHERLHNNSKKRLTSDSDANSENISNTHSRERISSCNRKMISKLIKEENSQCTFRPNIHKSRDSSRNGKAEERLFKDACQRKIRQNSRVKLEEKKCKEVHNLKSSDKSNSFAFKLFEKDFKNALERISKNQEDYLSYTELCSLMIELQMIDLKLMNTGKSDEERELLREMWRLLGCDVIDEQISCKSVKNFITIILNFDQKFLYFPEMDTIEDKHFDDKIVGIISKDGIFYIKNSKEIEKIHKSFYIFVINRFNNMSANRKIRHSSLPKSNININNSFVPQICQKSKEINKKKNSNLKQSKHNPMIKIDEKEHFDYFNKKENRGENEKSIFKQEHGESFHKKVKKIETPSSIVRLSAEGFKLEQSIQNVKLTHKVKKSNNKNKVIKSNKLKQTIEKQNISSNNRRSQENKAIIYHTQKIEDKVANRKGNLKCSNIQFPSVLKSLQLKTITCEENLNKKQVSNDSKFKKTENIDILNDSESTLRNKSKNEIKQDSEVVVYISKSSDEDDCCNEQTNNTSISNDQIKEAQNILENTRRKIDKIEKELKLEITQSNQKSIESKAECSNEAIQGSIKLKDSTHEKEKNIKNSRNIECNISSNNVDSHNSESAVLNQLPDDQPQITEVSQQNKSKHVEIKQLNEYNKDLNQFLYKTEVYESDSGEEDDEDDSQVPLLFIDVNLGKGVMKRIILYEGDDPQFIAEMFAFDNNLDPIMKEKLEKLLKRQMEGVLCKIEEGEEYSESNDD